jgi:glyoxylase-like metal-dependent hydrolase (beta-lactamase superfamily II)
MRALSLHSDVLVMVSRVWQTTCTAVRSGGEGFLIDSLVYPDELEALPAVLEQAGFPVSGLLATHADWDHLLGRLAFPGASLGCGESTAQRIAAELGGAQRELRRFDEEHYVQDRRPLALAGVQDLPVPGRLALGPEQELELHPADGHTADGMAIWIPWARVLVCGDYLSPVEIPMISESGSLGRYRATLERLRALLEHAEAVVPGHGSTLSAERALAVCNEDLEYLDALSDRGAAAELPPSRHGAAQKRIHESNVQRAGPPPTSGPATS